MSEHLYWSRVVDNVPQCQLIPPGSALRLGNTEHPVRRIYDVQWDRLPKAVQLTYLSWLMGRSLDTLSLDTFKTHRRNIKSNIGIDIRVPNPCVAKLVSYKDDELPRG